MTAIPVLLILVVVCNLFVLACATGKGFHRMRAETAAERAGKLVRIETRRCRGSLVDTHA